MKYILIIFFFASSVFANNDFRIMIDPGHGGNDLGAVRDSFVESKIVLMVSKKVKEQLEKLNYFDVHLTRENNNSMSLKDRVLSANKIGADIFISLHANTSSSATLSGMEFYFNSTHPMKKVTTTTLQKPWTNNEVIAQIQEDFKYYDKTEKSLILSKTIQNSTQNNVDKTVIKRAPFFVIENTEMPSILIELGFISNRREAKKLTSESYQDEIAKLIAQALIEYKEKSDKARPL